MCFRDVQVAFVGTDLLTRAGIPLPSEVPALVDHDIRGLVRGVHDGGDFQRAGP